VRSSDFKVVPRRLAVESTVRSEQLRVKRVPEEEDWEVTIEPETLEPREEMGEEAEAEAEAVEKRGGSRRRKVRGLRKAELNPRASMMTVKRVIRLM